MDSKIQLNKDEKISINIGKYINDRVFVTNLDKKDFLEKMEMFGSECDKNQMVVKNEKYYMDFEFSMNVDDEGNTECFKVETRSVNTFKGIHNDLRMSIFKKTPVPFYFCNLPKTKGNEMKVFTIILKHKYYEVHCKTKMNNNKESFYEITFVLTDKYTKYGLNNILKKLKEHNMKLYNIYSNDDILVTV